MKTEQKVQQEQQEPLLAAENLQNGGGNTNFHQQLENIHELVVNPTWRDVILDVVHSGKVDPWNLDIVDITNKYIALVKKMKFQNLHVPANVILAASILLRFKSESLDLKEEEEDFPTMDELGGLPDAGLEVHPLQLRFRIPPKRSIALSDLITSLNEAMDIEYRRENRPKLNVNPILEIKLPDYDIGKEMVSIIESVKALADDDGWLTFSQLLKQNEKSGSRDIVLTLLPILHLCQEHKLEIVQDEVFAEILIRVGENIDKPLRDKGGDHEEGQEEKQVKTNKSNRKLKNKGATNGRSGKAN